MRNPLTESELTEILRYRVKALMREGAELFKRKLYSHAHEKYYAALRELQLTVKYRQVPKSPRMVIARSIERRIVSNLQEIEDRIRGKKESVSNPIEDTTLTVYHATSLRNLGSITRRGILPRKPEFYDKLLRRLIREYRLDPTKIQQRKYYPKWIYEHLEEEIRYAKETRVRLVSLSLRPDYAIQNAYAGMEVEAYFRMYLEGLKTGKVRRYSKVYEEVAQGSKIVLFTIKIDIQDLSLRYQKVVERVMESEYPLTKIDEVRTKRVYPKQIVGWEIMEKPAWGERYVANPYKGELEIHKKTMQLKKQILNVAESVRPYNCEPPHGVQDKKKKLKIQRVMEKHGWIGAPLVADEGWLITGSHRWAAAFDIAREEYDFEIPVIQVEKLAKILDIDISEELEDAREYNNYLGIITIIDKANPEIGDWLGILT